MPLLAEIVEGNYSNEDDRKPAAIDQEKYNAAIDNSNDNNDDAYYKPSYWEDAAIKIDDKVEDVDIWICSFFADNDNYDNGEEDVDIVLPENNSIYHTIFFWGTRSTGLVLCHDKISASNNYQRACKLCLKNAEGLSNSNFV